MALNDAELRFQASLEDDASPGIDALVKKLQAAGASPTEIKMYLRAQDEATPHIDRVRKMMGGMPKEHTIRMRVASDEARGHLSALKREFAEPIEVPLKFTENLDQIGQKLFTFKSRYAIPMAGMIPGANMLYGVGMGAGVLGAAGAASDLLKKSVDVNAELQQQNASLTQALKDNTAATQEMNRVMGMAGQSQFGRSDMTQADIIARQFNLPAFAGESRYMTQGVIPQAQNLAAVGNTSVTQAAQAIAGATQGYFRQLLPYGISIRQEDFSPGGRFAGKSYQQAIDQATKRFQGAAEEQAKTFTGMLSRFKNMFEDKVLQPLGQFTFDQLGGALQNMLGGGTQQGLQERVSSLINKAQEELTKFWNLVEKGKSYFEVNLKKPLEDIVSNIIKVGTAFGKAFGTTIVEILKTLGEALVAIARPISQLVASHTGLVEFFGVMKALSVLGFKDISGPIVNPLKDLAGLHFVSLIRDLTALPGALTKIGVALAVKSFVDAHQATKALNDQFPTLKDHFADINSEVTVMAAKLNESSTHMKELVATAGQGLPTSLGDQRRLDLSKRVATAGVQLHQQFNIPEMDAVRMIAQQMQASGEFSNKAIKDFGTDLAEAQQAAKDLGFSFSDLQRIITQYAAVAGPVGLGGVQGAAALTGLQSGFNNIQMTKDQRDLYPTPDAMLRAMLQQYRNPSAADIQALGAQPYHASGISGPIGTALNTVNYLGSRPGLNQLGNYYNFQRPTNRQENTFFGNENTLLQQYITSRASNRQAEQLMHRATPDLAVSTTPIPGLSRYLGMSQSTYAQIAQDRNRPAAFARDIAGARVEDAKIYKDINNEVQRLQINIGTLTNKTADYQQQQARLNLHLQAFQRVLTLQQQGIEDASLAVQKYTFAHLHPLELQMTRLNQTMADNQHIMSNAQYEQSKWADGLFTGEQKALDQLHAMEKYNKQLQLMQEIYQSIGADLGTTLYDQGASVKVAPMSNFGLAMAQEIAQRKQAIAQDRYDLNYGEKHYQVGQAQRSEFQRTEHNFNQVMSHVKSTQGVIDATNRSQHQMENQQYTLSKQMYNVNQYIQKQQDGITRLQMALTTLQQSKKMRQFETDAYNMGRESDKAGTEISRLTQHMSALQNILDNTQQGKFNLGKIFGQTLTFSGKDSFANARRALGEALRSHFLDPTEYKRILGRVNEAESAARAVAAKHWYQNKEEFKNVLITAFKDAQPQHILSGRTARDVASAVQGPLSHIPVVGHALSNSTVGEAGAALLAAYLGISGVRAGRHLGRTALWRTGAWALSHTPVVGGLVDRHLIPAVARHAERVAIRRGRRAEALVTRLDAIPEHERSFLQNRRLEHARVMQTRYGAIASGMTLLQEGHEGDLRRVARLATREPFARAGESFHWIRALRERVGGGFAGAGGRALGSYLGGPVLGQAGAIAGEYIGGRHFAEHSTFELGKEGLDSIRRIVGHAENIHALLLAHAPLDTPQELREQAREVIGQLRKSNLSLDTVRQLQKSADDKLGKELDRQQSILNNPAATETDRQAAQRRVDAARRQVENTQKFEHAATEIRNSAVEVRKELGHKIREFGDATKNNVHDEHKNIAEDHKNKVREVADEHRNAKTMGQHVERYKVHVQEFGKKIAIFGTAVAAFEGIKDAIGRFFGHDPRHVPGHRHATTPDRGRPEEGVGVPHAVETPHVGLVRRGARGVFRAVGHGQRVFFGYGGAQGVIGGDPTSELFAGASTAEAAHAAAQAIKRAGGVKTAAAEHILSKYGEKYGTDKIAKRAFIRAAGSAGLDIAAGGTPVIGQIYDVYALNELLKHTPLGKAVSGPGTQQDLQNQELHRIVRSVTHFGAARNVRPHSMEAAHAINSAMYGNPLQRLLALDPNASNIIGGQASQSLTQNTQQQAQLASDLLHKNLTPDQYQTTLRKLVQLQDTYAKEFEKVTQTHDDASYQDLVNNHNKVLDKIKNHFGDRVDATKSGMEASNQAESDGYDKIQSTTSTAIGKLIKTVKGMDRSLGLSDNAMHHRTGGNSPASTSAGATAGQYAAGGVAIARAHELARQGGKLIKVGEEGPEMVVPLMPHRRDRAKSLINQAKSIIGMANGGYVNPLGGDTVTPERTDQGVDFALAPGNPIKAIGDARIAGIQQNWYNGQPFLWYQLLNGPRKGRYVFVAEQITSLAKQGSRVSAGDTIARYASSGTGIEMGWATSGGSTLAKTTSGYTEGQVTPAGSDFRAFLTSLGVPGDAGKTVPGLAGSAVAGAASMPLARWPRSLDVLSNFGYVGPRVRRIIRQHLNAYNRRARASGAAAGGTDLSNFQGGGDAQANMALGRRMASAMGWTGDQWDALKQLWIQESGWNSNIVNPSSGAYGIPQALGHGHPYNLGDAPKQIAWGLNYIKNRYGSPLAAEGHEKAFNWYHDGAWHVGDNVPAVLQKGEMVLPKSLAQSVRQNVHGASHMNMSIDQEGRKSLRQIERHMATLVEAMVKSEKHLKDLKDATEKKDETQHLRDLNASLTATRGTVRAAQNAAINKSISKELTGDPSDAEGTLARVRHERANLGQRMHMAAYQPTHRDRVMITHVNNLAHSAQNLLKTAHTKHQTELAKVAVHATSVAQKADKHLTTALHNRGQRDYIVAAAGRHVNASLLHSITGHALHGAALHAYTRVAQDRDHGHPVRAAADIKALKTALDRQMGTSNKHIEALRKEARKDADIARKTTLAAARAQGKTLTKQGRLLTTSAHAAVAQHRESTKAHAKADKTEQTKAKASAARDKKTDDHHKKVLDILGSIRDKDLSVNVINKATGATLTTTLSGSTRRRRR